MKADKRPLFYGLVASLLFAGCRMGSSSTVWTEAVVETREVAASLITAWEIRTSNGSVEYVANDMPDAPARVTITRKGGGKNMEEAKLALAAMEVYVEPGEGGLQRVGYRWNTERSPNWNASIDVSILGPVAVDLDAESHNGGINVRGVRGNVKLVTHNGRIKASSGGGALTVDTHNGGIEAVYAGPSISVKTHNGSVVVDLREAAAVGGAITTHNGGIVLAVSDKTSAMLSGETENGSVTIDVPLAEAKSSRYTVSGKLGAGGETLTLETHNGGIRVRNEPK